MPKTETATGVEVMAIMKNIASSKDLAEVPVSVFRETFAHLFAVYDSLLMCAYEGVEVELIIGEPIYMATLVGNVFGGSPKEIVGGFGFYKEGDLAVKFRDLISQALGLKGRKAGTNVYEPLWK